MSVKRIFFHLRWWMKSSFILIHNYLVIFPWLSPTSKILINTIVVYLFLHVLVVCKWSELLYIKRWLLHDLVTTLGSSGRIFGKHQQITVYKKGIYYLQDSLPSK